MLSSKLPRCSKSDNCIHFKCISFSFFAVNLFTGANLSYFLVSGLSYGPEPTCEKPLSFCTETFVTACLIVLEDVGSVSRQMKPRGLVEKKYMQIGAMKVITEVAVLKFISEEQG